MWDVTLLVKCWAFPQSRGLEGTAHSCRPLPHFSTLLPESETGWTLGPLPAPDLTPILLLRGFRLCAVASQNWLPLRFDASGWNQGQGLTVSRGLTYSSA